VAARRTLLLDVSWAFQILAATQFFLTGLDKLSDAPPMVQLFATVGLGQWLRYVTGVIEIAGSIALLVPSLVLVGAALLAMTMVGALVAHFTVLPFPPVKPITLLAMILVVALARRGGANRLS
jgi:putative oxidoreductase